MSERGPKLALVIEDERDLATIFSSAIKAAGFETEIISSGDAALERLGQVVPVLVVLDLNLPRVPGTTILQHIRADERLASTRVLVTTADARMAEQLQDKADLVLVKPISFSQLRDLAQRIAAAE